MSQADPQPPPAAPAAPRYALFISYKRRPDSPLARRIEQTLESFHEIDDPELKALALPKLDVFRDHEDLTRGASAGQADEKLRAAVGDCRALLILCNESTAAAGDWPDKEVRFAVEQGVEVLVGVSGGDPVKHPDAIFPPSLLDHSGGRPNDWFDFRVEGPAGPLDPLLRDEAVVALAAHLHQGRRAGELLPGYRRARQRERDARFRRLLWVTGLVVVIAALAVAGWIIAIRAQRAEKKLRTEAEAGAWALEARALAPTGGADAALLGAAAWARAPGDDTFGAWLDGVHDHDGWAAVTSLRSLHAVSPTGECVVGRDAAGVELEVCRPGRTPSLAPRPGSPPATPAVSSACAEEDSIPMGPQGGDAYVCLQSRLTISDGSSVRSVHVLDGWLEAMPGVPGDARLTPSLVPVIRINLTSPRTAEWIDIDGKPPRTIRSSVLDRQDAPVHTADGIWWKSGGGGREGGVLWRLPAGGALQQGPAMAAESSWLPAAAGPWVATLDVAGEERVLHLVQVGGGRAAVFGSDRVVAVGSAVAGGAVRFAWQSSTDAVAGPEAKIWLSGSPGEEGREIGAPRGHPITRGIPPGPSFLAGGHWIAFVDFPSLSLAPAAGAAQPYRPTRWTERAPLVALATDADGHLVALRQQSQILEACSGDATKIECQPIPPPKGPAHTWTSVALAAGRLWIAADGLWMSAWGAADARRIEWRTRIAHLAAGRAGAALSDGRSIAWVAAEDLRAREIGVTETDVVALAVLDSAGLIATAHEDDTIHLWSIQSAQEVARWTAPGKVLALHALADGSALVAGLERGLAHWPLGPEELLRRTCERFAGDELTRVAEARGIPADVRPACGPAPAP